MALEVAHGSLTWNTADAATTVYTVSGLAFQPKALIFWTNGQASATNAQSAALDSYMSIGLAAGTGDQRAACWWFDDGADPTGDSSSTRVDTIAHTANATAVDGRLRLDSITSDGFTLEVDDAAPVDIRVHWVAFGGSDITNVAGVTITEPTTAQNQSISVGFQPDVVFLIGTTTTAAPPQHVGSSGQLSFGWATGTGAGNQGVICVNDDQASATVDSDSTARGDICVAGITAAGAATLVQRGAFNGFTSTGFDINWLEVTTNQRRVLALAIKGGQWKAGNYSINTTSVGNTATVSGLVFQPIGAFVMGRGDQAESASDSAQAEAQFELGIFSSLSSRMGTGMWITNGASAGEANLTVVYDQVITSPTNAGGERFTVDANAINSDGFQMRVDASTGGTSTTFHQYLAFASSAVVTIPPPPQVGNYAVERSFKW